MRRLWSRLLILRTISAVRCAARAQSGGDEDPSAAQSSSLSSFFSPIAVTQPSKFLRVFRKLQKDGGPSSSAAGSSSVGSASSHHHTRGSSHRHHHTAAAPLHPDDDENIKIFRGDEHFQLSVDAPLRKVRESFINMNLKRCKLCNEGFTGLPSVHQNFVPHSAREALALEMLRAYCGRPEDVVNRWWKRLHNSTHFPRLKYLSSPNAEERRERVMHLLKFLRDRNVLRECFSVHGPGTGGGAGRSWEFERLEWVGDNVVKYVFNERIAVIFPLSEGGVRGRLGWVQNMIDGNDGLARAYDYFEMSQLTGSDRVISKFKSDVVEALFGELQVYLWSMEFDSGIERFSAPLGHEFIPLRAIVSHTMEELAHAQLMFHIDNVLATVQQCIHDNGWNFVRADPALRRNHFLRSELAAAVYAAKRIVGVSSDKIPRMVNDHSRKNSHLCVKNNFGLSAERNSVKPPSHIEIQEFNNADKNSGAATDNDHDGDKGKEDGDVVSSEKDSSSSVPLSDGASAKIESLHGEEQETPQQPQDGAADADSGAVTPTKEQKESSSSSLKFCAWQFQYLEPLAVDRIAPSACGKLRAMAESILARRPHHSSTTIVADAAHPLDALLSAPAPQQTTPQETNFAATRHKKKSAAGTQEQQYQLERGEVVIAPHSGEGEASTARRVVSRSELELLIADADEIPSSAATTNNYCSLAYPVLLLEGPLPRIVPYPEVDPSRLKCGFGYAHFCRSCGEWEYIGAGYDFAIVPQLLGEEGAMEETTIQMIPPVTDTVME